MRQFLIAIGTLVVVLALLAAWGARQSYLLKRREATFQRLVKANAGPEEFTRALGEGEPDESGPDLGGGRPMHCLWFDMDVDGSRQVCWDHGVAIEGWSINP